MKQRFALFILIGAMIGVMGCDNRSIEGAAEYVDDDGDGYYDCLAAGETRTADAQCDCNDGNDGVNPADGQTDADCGVTVNDPDDGNGDGNDDPDDGNGCSQPCCGSCGGDGDGDGDGNDDPDDGYAPNLEVVVYAPGGDVVDRITLDGELVQNLGQVGTSWTEDFRTVHNDRELAKTFVDPGLEAFRFNAEFQQGGNVAFLCEGFGDDATLTASVAVLYNGVSYGVQEISRVFTDANGNDNYGCDVIACFAGASCPNYLDLR